MWKNVCFDQARVVDRNMINMKIQLKNVKISWFNGRYHIDSFSHSEKISSNSFSCRKSDSRFTTKFKFNNSPKLIFTWLKDFSLFFVSSTNISKAWMLSSKSINNNIPQLLMRHIQLGYSSLWNSCLSKTWKWTHLFL